MFDLIFISTLFNLWLATIKFMPRPRPIVANFNAPCVGNFCFKPAGAPSCASSTKSVIFAPCFILNPLCISKIMLAIACKSALSRPNCGTNTIRKVFCHFLRKIAKKSAIVAAITASRPSHDLQFCAHSFFTLSKMTRRLQFLINSLAFVVFPVPLAPNRPYLSPCPCVWIVLTIFF